MHFWLIWNISQRALYNHALSVGRRHRWRHRPWIPTWPRQQVLCGIFSLSAGRLHHHWCRLCTPLLATWLDIEAS